MKYAAAIITAILLAAGFAGATRAQPPSASHPSAAPEHAAPPSQAALSRAIHVQAGTGTLLHLPQAAASMMSAQPDIARVQPASPTSLFLMGVAPGRTTVIATSGSGAAIAQYDVTVTAAGHTGHGVARPARTATVSAATLRSIQAAIAQSVVGASGVHARAAGSNVMLTGTVPTALAAQQAEAIARGYVGDKAQVLNQMLVLGSLQVNVRVRIAEINRQIVRQLGFNWQALGAGTNWQFGLLTGAAAAGPISALLPLGLTPTSNVSPGQIGGGYHSANWDINGVIDALAADNLITILAEPNLTAQSGETASFLAGGEFPIPVAGNTSNGSTTVTVQFKQFGISLSLVPTVLSPRRLNLRVRPEVSQLSKNGAVSLPIAGGSLTIPALTVRRAETTVELGSGQSFAIAGLMQKTTSDVTNALPGIGEVPVLGALFKSNDFQRGEDELVIIVTPYLVKPAASPAQLHAPTDNFRPATDLDRILFGRQLAPTGPALPSLDAGFILK